MNETRDRSRSGRRRETRAISTRQCCRIESSATRSKQRFGARATRQFLDRKGSQVDGEPSLGDQASPTQTSVKTFQMFSLLSHSKQTIEAHNKCQFFAMRNNGLTAEQVTNRQLVRARLQPCRIAPVLEGVLTPEASAAKAADRPRIAARLKACPDARNDNRRHARLKPGATFTPSRREESPFGSLRSKPRMPD